MGNASGVWAVLASIVSPGLVVPHAQVDDISHIDWSALRRAGVRHIVIDKDNCITLPLQNNVAPQLESAWQRLSAAGFDSVLIVSNSAGSSDDPMAIGAEHLARTLQQRVLAHPAKKPAMACARQIIEVLEADHRAVAPKTTTTSPSAASIAVIGDRITTDIVLANRMQRIVAQRRAGGMVASILRSMRQAQSSSSSSRTHTADQVVGILTTKVLQPERFGTRTMRSLEMWTLGKLIAVGIQPGAGWLSRKQPHGGQDWQSIVSQQVQEGLTSADRQTFHQVADEAAAAAEAASREAHAQLPITVRIRKLPSLALQRIGAALMQAGVWLGQGWCLIQDGIRLGTKGKIGAPDANRVRHSRLLGASGNDIDVTAMHLRDGWPGTSQMFSRRDVQSIGSRSRPARIERFSALRQRAFCTSRQQANKAATSSGARRPSPRWNPIYLAAGAALVLMPSGYYVGMLLHDYVYPPTHSDEEIAAEALRLQERDAQKGPLGLSARTEQLSSRGSSSAAQSLSDYFAGKPTPQSLYTRRVSIERQLEQTEAKLVEIRARIASRKAMEAAGEQADRKSEDIGMSAQDPTAQIRIV